MAGAPYGLADRFFRRIGMPAGGSCCRRNLLGSDSGRLSGHSILADTVVAGGAGGVRGGHIVEAGRFGQDRFL